MDLRTRYMGMELKSPLMPGASPLSENLDDIKRMEEAGASAVVVYSLFEEQIVQEQLALQRQMEEPANSFAEALTYFPDLPDLCVGSGEYLEQIQKIKKAVSIPVIGSLNGSTPGGWIEYAKKIEEAGADALELNIFFLGTSFEETSEQVDARCVEIVREVKRAVRFPVAVKIGPFFSSTAHAIHRMDEAGADGLVLFNRFYQPDIDIEALEVVPRHGLSSSEELRLRLRWLALLSFRVKASLAVTGGVHTAEDAVKAVMAGAHAVQLVSVLLRHGPGYLKKLTEDLTRWMEDHEYRSLDELRGTMSLEAVPDPAVLTRANYLQILKSW